MPEVLSETIQVEIPFNQCNGLATGRRKPKRADCTGMTIENLKALLLMHVIAFAYTTRFVQKENNYAI